jgi:prepilin-type N-terminal cleavage/methylation domain-containing protein
MMPAHRSAGFSLVEVMVAVVLLSIMALGLGSTLIAAQRARAHSEHWMQAIQLAAEGLEQLRAGHALAAVAIPGAFTRSSSITPWRNHPGLYRLEVTVTWEDSESRSFQLLTLARR